MDTLRRKYGWTQYRAGAATVAFILIGATGGAATAASLDGNQRDALQADAVLAQAAPARVMQTVLTGGQANSSASERAAVVTTPDTSLPATDQDQPNAGALVLAVLGLALWVGARLRRQD
jgi:Zn-dependent protease with chaperone function